MIAVKIELWPHGDESRSKEIGRMYIANDGSGTIDRGDYQIAVCRRNSEDVPQPIDPEGPKATRAAEVKNYPRQAYNVWRLIAQATLAAFPEETTARAKPGNKPIIDAAVMRGLKLLRDIAPAYAFATDAEVDAVYAAIAWLEAANIDAD